MRRPVPAALVLAAVVAAVLGVAAYAATREQAVSVRTVGRPTLGTRPTRPGLETTTTTAAAIAPVTMTTTTTTTTPPTTIAVGAASRFNPKDFDLVATLTAAFDSGTTGMAGAKRLSPTEWQITVFVRHAKPGVRYGVIVVADDPADPYTPGPTPCTFTARPDGTGGCSGTMAVGASGTPHNISVLDGPAQAWGQFAPRP